MTGEPEPNFKGLTGSTCEHRTVGPHRAWCHQCNEWCYPSDPCVRCKALTPVDWPARLRAAAKMANRGCNYAAEFHLLSMAGHMVGGDPHVVEAISRALNGEQADQ